jgi:hypothetical protein
MSCLMVNVNDLSAVWGERYKKNAQTRQVNIPLFEKILN